jgi:hypothetical protein
MFKLDGDISIAVTYSSHLFQLLPKRPMIC